VSCLRATVCEVFTEAVRNDIIIYSINILCIMVIIQFVALSLDRKRRMKEKKQYKVK